MVVLLGVAGGADHQQDPNYTFDSLGLNVHEIGHLQGVKSVMAGPFEGLFTVSKKYRGCNPLDHYIFKTCKRIINRTHQNTSDSLKASMVAPFANITREEITLARPTTALESSTSPKQRVASSILFAFILYYILFSCNIYNISCP